MTNLPLSLIISGAIVGFLLLLILIVKSRYVSFSNEYYVLVFRNGHLYRKSSGGAFFLLPLLDEVEIVPADLQRINFSIRQDIVFKPKFRDDSLNRHIKAVKIAGFLVYEIVDAVQFQAKSSRYDNRPNKPEDRAADMVMATSIMFQDLIESHLKSEVLLHPLDDLHDNRDQLVNSSTEIISEYKESLGLSFGGITLTSFEFEYTQFED